MFIVKTVYGHFLHCESQIVASQYRSEIPRISVKFNYVTHFNGFSSDSISGMGICVKAREKKNAIKRLHLTEAHTILRTNLGYR